MPQYVTFSYPQNNSTIISDGHVCFWGRSDGGQGITNLVVVQVRNLTDGVDMNLNNVYMIPTANNPDFPSRWALLLRGLEVSKEYRLEIEARDNANTRVGDSSEVVFSTPAFFRIRGA
jgi:hypothetical protein